MAKFYGEVGFVSTVESAPGVYSEEITKRNYYGDVIKNYRRLDSGTGLNDNLALNNQISIVSDDYADKNFANIRYVKWIGAAWKITNVDVQRPRLILTVGGVYNEPED